MPIQDSPQSALVRLTSSGDNISEKLKNYIKCSMGFTLGDSDFSTLIDKKHMDFNEQYTITKSGDLVYFEALELDMPPDLDPHMFLNTLKSFEICIGGATFMSVPMRVILGMSAPIITANRVKIRLNLHNFMMDSDKVGLTLVNLQYSDVWIRVNTVGKLSPKMESVGLYVYLKYTYLDTEPRRSLATSSREFQYEEFCGREYYIPDGEMTSVVTKKGSADERINCITVSRGVLIHSRNVANMIESIQFNCRVNNLLGRFLDSDYIALYGEPVGTSNTLLYIPFCPGKTLLTPGKGTVDPSLYLGDSISGRAPINECVIKWKRPQHMFGMYMIGLNVMRMMSGTAGSAYASGYSTDSYIKDRDGSGAGGSGAGRARDGGSGAGGGTGAGGGAGYEVRIDNSTYPAETLLKIMGQYRRYQLACWRTAIKLHK